MAPVMKDQAGRLGGERYYPCRSFVYAPTKLGDHPRRGISNALPDARLELDFVYGYNAGAIVGAPSTEMGIKMGGDAQDNLRWLDERRIVYFASGTAIVYDIPLHKQRFFFGHDDAITYVRNLEPWNGPFCQNARVCDLPAAAGQCRTPRIDTLAARAHAWQVSCFVPLPEARRDRADGNLSESFRVEPCL
jgi:hypothetical protein